MRYALGVVSLISFASASYADKLDDAWAICKPHKADNMVRNPTGNLVPGPVSGYKPYDDVWTHCNNIEVEFFDRKRARDAKDEANNPDLAKTRAVSKELSK